MNKQLVSKFFAAFTMVMLVLAGMPVSPAFAATSVLVPWAKAYDQASGTATGINRTILNGSNRVLVVGIVTASASSQIVGDVNGDPTVITYGGVTLTKATGNGLTSGRMHTWLYYLKENAVMDNTARPLNVTMAGAIVNMTVWSAVYAGVDQSLPYATGNNLINVSGSGPAQLSAAMAVNAGQQAIYISGVYDATSVTIPAYTLNANWATAGSNTGTNPAGTGIAWIDEVVSRTVPVANVTDNAATSAITPAGVIRYAISAMSLPAAVPPTFTSLAPAGGTVNSAYSHTYTATGTTPITYSVTVGSLPPGLTLVAGVLSGTPPTAGTYSGTVTAANGVLPNASQAFSITINKANTTTAITSDTPDPSVVGEPVAINFTVTGGAPTTPTSNVTVSDGTQSCTATVATGTCSITFTALGAKLLTATYVGDTNFNGSASAPSTAHTVNLANTTTSITSDTPDPSAGGQAVTVQYAVAVNAPGSGIPTGNVTVSDGVDSCTASIAAGQCNIILTTNGARTLTATYAGDANFNTSTSAGAAHTVDANAPTVSSIDRGNGNPSNLASVDFTVTFSESVTGGSASNFSLVTTGAISGASITSVSAGPGTTRTVTVNTGTGDGTIGLNLINGTGIADLIGNALSTSTFTGQIYTIIKSGPSVTIGAPSLAITSSGPVDFPVAVFFASTVNLTNGDVSLNTTGTAAGTINVTNGSTNNPTVTISAISGDGTIGISIAAGVAADSALPTPNVNPAVGPSATFKVDNTAPKVVTNGVNTNQDTGDGILSEFEVVKVGVAQITVSFTEDVTLSSATNVSNYMLVNDNGNGFDDTPTLTTCATGINPNGGNDSKIVVNSASYNNNGGSGPFVSTLNVNNGNWLTSGDYRLYVCGTTSITDSVGNELNRIGLTLLDFRRNFNVINDEPSAGRNTLSTITQLPITGFPMGKVTKLPSQPANLAYASYSDLWLEIPALKIKKMTIVGVPASTESWDVSWLGKDAGWLNGSAFPTWDGNSVITGHVWDAMNKPGPFAELKQLKYGDQIKIHAFGQVYIYEIRESKLISSSNKASVFKHEEKSWITLVTCEDYKEQSQKYLYRRMVRAVLISVGSEE